MTTPGIGYEKFSKYVITLCAFYFYCIINFFFLPFMLRLQKFTILAFCHVLELVLLIRFHVGHISEAISRSRQYSRISLSELTPVGISKDELITAGPCTSDNKMDD